MNSTCKILVVTKMPFKDSIHHIKNMSWIASELEAANDALESGLRYKRKDYIITAYNTYNKYIGLLTDKKEATEKVIRCLTGLSYLEPNSSLGYLKKALEFDENCPDVLNNLGFVYHKYHRDYDTSVNFYQKCIELNPTFVLAYIGIIDVYRTLRLHELELKYVEKALKSCADNAELWNMYGLALINNQRYNNISLIHKTFNKAMELADTAVVRSKIYMNKGHLQGVVGEFALAVDNYLSAIDQDPSNNLAYQNILLNLHFFSEKDIHNRVFRNVMEKFKVTYNKKSKIVDIISELHQRIAGLLYGHEKSACPVKQSSFDRLRIGYLTADIIDHAVSYFAKALFTHANRSFFDVYVYSNTVYDAGTINQIPCTKFTFIDGMTAEDACNIIKGDKIDILIDLSGHTAGNRLDVMAKRPASLLFTYLGYPDKIGLDYIYRISDEYTEKGHRDLQNVTKKMDRLFLCYGQKEMYKEHVKSYDKFDSTKVITLGSFAKLQKINQNVIDTWCMILKRLPNARIVIKSRYFSDEKVKHIWKSKFKEFCNRVCFLKGAKTQRDHMSLYKMLDIQLDTFPYSGTTITTESLFMNVPVVTLSRDCDGHVSRVSGSILTSMRMDSLLVAESEKEYIDKVVALVPQLKQIGVRNRLLSSDINNPKTLVENFEKILIDTYTEQKF